MSMKLRSRTLSRQGSRDGATTGSADALVKRAAERLRPDMAKLVEDARGLARDQRDRLDAIGDVALRRSARRS